MPNDQAHPEAADPGAPGPLWYRTLSYAHREIAMKVATAVIAQYTACLESLESQNSAVKHLYEGLITMATADWNRPISAADRAAQQVPIQLGKDIAACTRTAEQLGDQITTATAILEAVHNDQEWLVHVSDPRGAPEPIHNVLQHRECAAQDTHAPESLSTNNIRVLMHVVRGEQAADQFGTMFYFFRGGNAGRDEPAAWVPLCRECWRRYTFADKDNAQAHQRGYRIADEADPRATPLMIAGHEVWNYGDGAHVWPPADDSKPQHVSDLPSFQSPAAPLQRSDMAPLQRLDSAPQAAPTAPVVSLFTARSCSIGPWPDEDDTPTPQAGFTERQGADDPDDPLNDWSAD